MPDLSINEGWRMSKKLIEETTIEKEGRAMLEEVKQLVHVDTETGAFFFEFPLDIIPDGALPFDLKIIGIGLKPADQFTANPMNPKYHPEEQRKVMEEILGKFGIVGLVTENQRSGMLLDGHDRIYHYMQNGGEQTLVPYAVIDISQQDEDDLIVLYDSVTSLAGVNRENLTHLLRNSKIDEDTPSLSGFMNRIAMENRIIPAQFEPEDIPEKVESESKTVKCPNCEHEFYL